MTWPFDWFVALHHPALLRAADNDLSAAQSAQMVATLEAVVVAAAMQRLQTHFRSAPLAPGVIILPRRYPFRSTSKWARCSTGDVACVSNQCLGLMNTDTSTGSYISPKLNFADAIRVPNRKPRRGSNIRPAPAGGTLRFCQRGCLTDRRSDMGMGLSNLYIIDSQMDACWVNIDRKGTAAGMTSCNRSCRCTQTHPGLLRSGNEKYCATLTTSLVTVEHPPK
jgi:hypothetical protein